jgi:5'-nucleotidase, C-terminal domain
MSRSAPPRSRLDSRRSTVRIREAAIGNLIADAMGVTGRTDAAIMNCGGIRADRVYPARGRPHAAVRQPHQTIAVGGVPLADGKMYRVATNDFIARGGDGYVTLRDAKRLLPDEDSPLLANQVMVYVRQMGTVRTSVEGESACGERPACDRNGGANQRTGANNRHIKGRRTRRGRPLFFSPLGVGLRWSGGPPMMPGADGDHIMPVDHWGV